ncbi:hypothetical protein J2X69_005149 [Algoriphagus sp. 4150]|nr:hypothetical protein [Algoriphagus sp. 4150]MDR7132775.1 hypothetical protein [Algoriphagus sp. 4150]
MTAFFTLYHHHSFVDLKIPKFAMAIGIQVAQENFGEIAPFWNVK